MAGGSIIERTCALPVKFRAMPENVMPRVFLRGNLFFQRPDFLPNWARYARGENL